MHTEPVNRKHLFYWSALKREHHQFANKKNVTDEKEIEIERNTHKRQQ